MPLAGFPQGSVVPPVFFLPVSDILPATDITTVPALMATLPPRRQPRLRGESLSPAVPPRHVSSRRHALSQPAVTVGCRPSAPATTGRLSTWCTLSVWPSLYQCPAPARRGGGGRAPVSSRCKSRSPTVLASGRAALARRGRTVVSAELAARGALWWLHVSTSVRVCEGACRSL